jgi:probable O-glycosylation ligase (exosortase A-associated)
MRDIGLLLFVLGLLPFAFKRPAIGIYLFTWISLMNPHRLAYGFAFEFPFAALIAGVTLIGMFTSREPKSLPMTPMVVVLILFMCWMTLTGFSAFEQDSAWTEWNRVFKTILMVLVTMAVISRVEDIKYLAVVIALSLGFYGFKGGVFTILTGGHSRVLGPPDTYIGDNNDLALALVMTTPLIWYLVSLAPKKWLRYGAIALTVLTLAAAAGSYSRGALLAGGAMLTFLWLKSANKARTGVVLLMAVPLLYLLMPEAWFSRMDSIGDYKQDDSALGRINSWNMAFNIASHNLMGGGYRCFTPAVFRVWAPEPLNVHAPHSIYFQVLGEHGFIGLALFLLFLFLAWRTGSRVLKFCKGKPELQWASGLAAMCQVSLVGYTVGGAFLTLAYYDLLYDIIAILFALEKVLILVPAKSKVPKAADAPLAPAVPAAPRKASSSPG